MTMAKKKSDLIPRLVTAAVAIPLLLALIFLAPAWGFYVLIIVAGGISAWEYCTITFAKESLPVTWACTLLTAGVMATMVWSPAHLVGVLALAGVLLFLIVLFTHTDQTKITQHVGSSITAVVYAGVIFGCVALMRQFTQDAGPYWVLLALAIIWGADSGAYFAGRLFGKHKLAPTVSPNKTIEGAIGGLVAAIAFTFGFNLLFEAVSTDWVPLRPLQVLLLAIPANFLGQAGDLCESLLKRAHGVKDSGTIIYGHGGMLDRIDALIMASPWFYIFVTTMGPQAV